MSSASLSEARQLYEALEEIENKLKEINTSAGATTIDEAAVKLNTLRISLNECYMLSRRLFILIKRISPNEDFNEAIATVQRFIFIINSLRISILALEASSGPVGWALAGLGILSAGVFALDEVSNEFERMFRK